MSDQDFFFDEDEQPAKPAAPKPASKTAAAKPASRASKPVPAPAGGIELTWTVTGLVAVVALLLGVIIGYAIPKGADIAAPTTAGTTSQSAPQLSPDQLSSGQLPAGHPDIGGMSGSGSATSTGAATGASGETTPSN